ncbi:MAG: LacI family DNA-binding transcriptional regulator [Oscillospiraceae bacterium]
MDKAERRIDLREKAAKKVTIKDIARMSGYSVGTVSRVLNESPNVSEDARRKVEAVVKATDFRLNSNAKHLRQQTNTGIAVIVKGAMNMLFASLVEQLQGLIRERGYACLIYYIDEDDNEVALAIQVCRERHPQGILFLGSTLDDFRRQFSAVTVPCVLVTNSAAALGFANLSSVSTDDAAGAEKAIEHFLALGHRKIGILAGKTGISNAANTRYQGCLRAFAAHGLPFDPERQMVMARFGLASGYDAMTELLDKMPDLTAVFAMSDVMAVGAIRAIRDRGLLVPGDISVIGYDGIDLGRYLDPQLTTIRQHREVIARRSVEILLRCMREHTPAIHEITPFDLIPGGSVRRL